MCHMNDICAIKRRLIEVTKCEVEKDLEEVNAAELGEVVDMIKDLYEAEMLCWEKEYYESVVHAMEESEEGEYGKPYNQYTPGMRHEHHHEKKEMTPKEHVEHALMTMRDIWKDADPAMKQKMKTDLTTLVGEMKI